VTVRMRHMNARLMTLMLFSSLEVRSDERPHYS